MVKFEEYVEGTYGNSRNTLARYAEYLTVLRTLNRAYEHVLPRIGAGKEGAAIFAGMSHAAFLAGVKLASAGELPPAYMVLRGCIEDALYGFYLFHHPKLKSVWMARHDSDAAKQKVRDEFPVAAMKKFLAEKNAAIGHQFGLVYDTSIDFGAHPNPLVFTSHLAQAVGFTDQIWQYINLTPVDQAMALRVASMAGLNALNIFALVFPRQFTESGAATLLARAHDQLTLLPEPGSKAESESARDLTCPRARPSRASLSMVAVGIVLLLAATALLLRKW